MTHQAFQQTSSQCSSHESLTPGYYFETTYLLHRSSQIIVLLGDKSWHSKQEERSYSPANERTSGEACSGVPMALTTSLRSLSARSSMS